MPPSDPSKRDIRLISCLALLALVVRLSLSWRGFYGMESTYEFVMARMGWADAMRAMVKSGHAPLNMILLKLWALPGDGERWMMTLPALEAALAVIVAWHTLWQARGRAAALWAAGFTAFSPMLLQVAISPRFENTLLLLGWLNLWSLQRLTDPERQKTCLVAMVLFPLTAMLGAFTFAYWYLYMAPVLLCLVWQGIGPLHRRLLLAGISGLLMLPMVVVILGQAPTYLPPKGGLSASLLFHRLTETTFAWWGGYHLNWFENSSPASVGKWILAVSLVAVAVAATRTPRGSGRTAAIISMGSLTLAVAAFVLRGLPLTPKYLVFLAPPVAVWLASTLPQPWPAARVACALMVVVWGLGVFTLHGAIHRPRNNRTAVALLAKRIKKGEAVYVIPASFANVVTYYAPALTVRGLPKDHDYMKDAYGENLTPAKARRLAASFPKGKRVWLFYAQGYGPYTDRRGWLHAAMTRRFTPVELTTFAEDNYFSPRAKLVLYRPVKATSQNP